VSILEIDVDDLHDRQREGEVVLVDVRQPDEFADGHVPGAVLIPLAELPERVDELPTGAPITLICHTGGRSHRAAEMLSSQGFETINVVGGTLAWTEAGFPVDR
jgi:rhodanese-related sulfurtransferase